MSYHFPRSRRSRCVFRLRNKLAVALLSVAAAGGASADTASFGIIFMPDTQFYSRYATAAEGNQFITRYGSNPYAAQTDWIAQHAAELGIPMVIHLGDVVDQQSKVDEWAIARESMAILETAAVPYSILAGNHDVVNSGNWDDNRTLSAEPFPKSFPLSRAQRQSTFRGMDSRGFHQYHIFEFQGQKFMNIALSWRASTSSINWAKGVIAANPTIPVILSTHELLGVDSDGVSAIQTSYSDYLWDNLIKDNDQIFMAIGGHNHGSGHLIRKNSKGYDVLEVVVDYQMSYQGGNGYLRLCEFDLIQNQIKSMSFSPWVPTKPQGTTNQFDKAVLTEPNNEYVTEMNFAQRFSGFSTGFPVGTPNRTNPLTETVRSMILENYEEPEAPSPTLPYDCEDYPHNPSTVAHWRFDSGAAGTAVADGATITDSTGRNPLVRAPLTNGALVGDVTWTDDYHALSAAAGSVNFSANSNSGKRESFFQTLANAPLNGEFFRNGYTIEAVIKIDKNWTPGANAWMNIMTRDGNRGNLKGWSGGDGESNPLLFAVSSLREIQWEPTIFTATGYAARTNWSGEIMADVWTHVAIVNEPGTHNTTMYVAGAPVLRNVSGADGIAGYANLPWVVGAGLWGSGRTDGFLGKISEIRISNEALGPQQWLTARKTRVVGTGGRQAIVGTAGDDQIIGNPASDVLSGSAGADTFVYQTQRDGTDTITDFSPTEDKINIDKLLQEMNYTGSNPVTDQRIRIMDSSRGAVVQIALPGSSAYRNLIILQGVSAAQVDLNASLIY